MLTNIDPSTDPDSSPDALEVSQLLLSAYSPQSLSMAQIQQLSPIALAYLGDAVYELFVRRCFLFPPQRVQTYHRRVVAQVRAEAQARHLQTLIPLLTESELEWLRRGRNAATNRSRRVEADISQQASSLETLVGYLHLTNPQRLLDLLNSLDLSATEIP